MEQAPTKVKAWFKEMPCARILYGYKNDGTKEIKKEFYNLFLPHVYEEIRNQTNFVAVNCFPPNFIDENLKKEIIKYIKENIKDDLTKIYFDNVYEGHFYACLPTILEIINILNLNPKNCYFITGAMNASTLYDEYANKYNLEDKINIIVLTSWERHIQNSKITEDLKSHNYVVGPKEKLFLCFNRIFRSHRLALLGLLYKKNLVDTGYYSFFPDCTYGGKVDINVVKGDLSTDVANLVLSEYEKHRHELPLLLNNPDASPTNYIIASDLDYYDNSYFSLVTETFFFSRINTVFDEHAVFFSEKIYKPMICKHPFVLVGRPKSLQYLRKCGFKTFHPYIDESYDLVENDEARLLAVVNEVERLSKKTTNEWIDLLKAMEEVINHNFKIMINKRLSEHMLKY